MHVFISYVKEDKDQVYKMVDYLEYFGINVWLDKKDLKIGSFFPMEIRDAIKSGNFFIACFSKNYSKRYKTYMNEELLIAIQELRYRPMNRSWFLPVLLSECEVPSYNITPTERLKDIQSVALFKDFEIGMQQIIQTISPKLILKKINKLIIDAHSDNEYIQEAAIHQLHKLPKCTDKRVIKSIADIYLSEKTDEITSSVLHNILSEYDVVSMLINLLIIKYKNKKIVESSLYKLSIFCSPLSIAVANPDFISKCQANNITYNRDKINVPYFAWHLTFESFIRLRDLFQRKKRFVWHPYYGDKLLDFEYEIVRLELCNECNRKEGLCIKAEGYADSGDSGYIDTYECAYCGHIWTEDVSN